MNLWWSLFGILWQIFGDIRIFFSQIIGDETRKSSQWLICQGGDLLTWAVWLKLPSPSQLSSNVCGRNKRESRFLVLWIMRERERRGVFMEFCVFWECFYASFIMKFLPPVNVGNLWNHIIMCAYIILSFIVIELSNECYLHNN